MTQHLGKVIVYDESTSSVTIQVASLDDFVYGQKVYLTAAEPKENVPCQIFGQLNMFKKDNSNGV
jgi:hypothetical protein